MNTKVASVIAIAAAVVVGIVYVTSDSQSDRHTAVPPGPVRLADLLAVASIESPLTRLTSADEGTLGDAARAVVFAEDFETFDMQKAGWGKSGGVF